MIFPCIISGSPKTFFPPKQASAGTIDFHSISISRDVPATFRRISRGPMANSEATYQELQGRSEELRNVAICLFLPPREGEFLLQRKVDPLAFVDVDSDEGFRQPWQDSPEAIDVASGAASHPDHSPAVTTSSRSCLGPRDVEPLLFGIWTLSIA
jgi:hypothetical protein